ncbi:enoyl-CoA hydratase [Pelistega indica]|uniref:enoyl-CoA hydratase n=1 Tax=Pelistega indica TaxID=1414851 RepID=V8FUF0_9BURK|nr:MULTISPECIES: enoyl-CoA hydratase [Pelistega]ETD67037.1 enoyl-CoA hydratase [Pelistega indica]
MSEQLVLSTIQGKVGILTLNRPKVLNALNNDIMLALSNELLALEKNENVHVIVLTGSEKAFAAGADISAMQKWSYMDVYKSDYIGGFWETMKTSIRKPVIAAVSGYALGGGCELAMMCDLIYAAENAKFGQPEIKLGTIPGLGGTQRLTRAVGKAKAMDLVLTGRFMDAQEAESAGLVARILPNENFLDEVIKIADGMANFSSPVLMMAKQCVNAALETTLEQGLAYERRVFHATFALEDQKEGMSAFVEKRAPNFKNM